MSAGPVATSTSIKLPVTARPPLAAGPRKPVIPSIKSGVKPVGSKATQPGAGAKPAPTAGTAAAPGCNPAVAAKPPVAKRKPAAGGTAPATASGESGTAAAPAAKKPKAPAGEKKAKATAKAAGGASAAPVPAAAAAASVAPPGSLGLAGLATPMEVETPLKAAVPQPAATPAGCVPSKLPLSTGTQAPIAMAGMQGAGAGSCGVEQEDDDFQTAQPVAVAPVPAGADNAVGGPGGATAGNARKRTKASDLDYASVETKVRVLFIDTSPARS